jgi:hypothetical protein
MSIENDFALIQDFDKNYCLQVFNPLPVAFVKGKGCYLYDTEGKKYLDFAFETAVDTIDVGAFGHDDAKKIIITGMKAFLKKNDFEFTDEEIEARAEAGLKGLAVADADFDTKHRADSVNAPKETTHEDFLEFAFESVTSTLDLGGFRPEDALKMAVTGMKAYAYDNNQKFTNEEIINVAKKKMKEIFGASKDYEYQDWAMPR